MTRPSAAVVATAVALLLLVVTTVLGAPLRTDAAPLGIVSLQLATGADAAARILASWSGVDRSWILLTHAVDLLLPIAYAAALVLLARAAGSRAAAVTAVGAAVADQLENVLMLGTILRVPTDAVVRTTLAAALVKWTLLAIAPTLLVMAARRRSRRRMVAG